MGSSEQPTADDSIARFRQLTSPADPRKRAQGGIQANSRPPLDCPIECLLSHLCKYGPGDRVQTGYDVGAAAESLIGFGPSSCRREVISRTYSAKLAPIPPET